MDVFTNDKTEISLTRQDLVELINVRISFIYFFIIWSSFGLVLLKNVETCINLL